jgi:uncharacterized protein YfbU (UPF0304 family)
MPSTLTVRLGDDLYEQLAALAGAQGTTISELARTTLAQLLTPPKNDERRVYSPTAPDSLTTVQRHMLAVLHEIAEKVGDPGRAEGHKYANKVFTNGYVIEYPDVLQEYDTELTEREAELVMDIFEMFTTLRHSYDQLTAEQRKSLGAGAKRDIAFFGFDGNSRTESRLGRYAQHLIATDRWTNLAEHFDAQHERGNSHMPAVPIYERMLEEFRPIWRRKIRDMGDYALTVGEIRQVTAAKVHPDNRPTKSS